VRLVVAGVGRAPLWAHLELEALIPVFRPPRDKGTLEPRDIRREGSVAYEAWAWSLRACQEAWGNGRPPPLVVHPVYIARGRADVALAAVLVHRPTHVFGACRLATELQARGVCVFSIEG